MYILNMQYEGCQWQYGLQYRYIEKLDMHFSLSPYPNQIPIMYHTQLVPIFENFGM